MYHKFLNDKWPQSKWYTRKNIDLKFECDIYIWGKFTWALFLEGKNRDQEPGSNIILPRLEISLVLWHEDKKFTVKILTC